MGKKSIKFAAYFDPKMAEVIERKIKECGTTKTIFVKQAVMRFMLDLDAALLDKLEEMEKNGDNNNN